MHKLMCIKYFLHICFTQFPGKIYMIYEIYKRHNFFIEVSQMMDRTTNWLVEKREREIEKEGEKEMCKIRHTHTGHG